ncbi:MOG1 family protein [Abortiporus biennis]
MSAERQLFGGAITVLLPTDLIDASDLRQIPDTQEVFLYPHSGVSIIVEVLKKTEPSDLKEAARFHFDALAHDNSAQSSTVIATNIVPNDRGDETPSAVVLAGKQNVSKFNTQTPDEIQIFLALYRIEQKNVDLVMTMNVPVRASDGGEVPREQAIAAEKTFETAAKSLKILDFGLFA